MSYPENTVAEVRGGDIVIVGEKHGGEGVSYSNELGERVAEAIEPGAVALEAAEPHRGRVTSGAMGAAYDYATDVDIPVLYIDKPGTRRGLDVANAFPFPIEEDGDIDSRGPRWVRRSYYELFGEEAYHEMYTAREEMMARRLLAARSEYETPILAAVGAYHVKALADELEGDVEPVAEISPQRVANA